MPSLLKNPKCLLLSVQHAFYMYMHVHVCVVHGIAGSCVDDFIQVHEEGVPLNIANVEDCHYAMFVSFAEIYNNLVFDLLADPPETGKHHSSLKIQQDKNHNNYIKGERK